VGAVVVPAIKKRLQTAGWKALQHIPGFLHIPPLLHSLWGTSFLAPLLLRQQAGRAGASAACPLGHHSILHYPLPRWMDGRLGRWVPAWALREMVPCTLPHEADLSGRRRKRSGATEKPIIHTHQHSTREEEGLCRKLYIQTCKPDFAVHAGQYLECRCKRFFLRTRASTDISAVAWRLAGSTLFMPVGRISLAMRGLAAGGNGAAPRFISHRRLDCALCHVAHAAARSAAAAAIWHHRSQNGGRRKTYSLSSRTIAASIALLRRFLWDGRTTIQAGALLLACRLPGRISSTFSRGLPGGTTRAHPLAALQ